MIEVESCKWDDGGMKRKAVDTIKVNVWLKIEIWKGSDDRRMKRFL